MSKFSKPKIYKADTLVVLAPYLIFLGWIIAFSWLITQKILDSYPVVAFAVFLIGFFFLWYLLDRTTYKIIVYSDGRIEEHRLWRVTKVLHVSEIESFSLKIFRALPFARWPAAGMIDWPCFLNSKYKRFPYLPISPKVIRLLCSIRPELSAKDEVSQELEERIRVSLSKWQSSKWRHYTLFLILSIILMAVLFHLIHLRYK